MVDEPGGWELRRALDETRKDMRDGFAQLNQRLDKLVTTDAFNAEQRRVDDRLKDLADDIAAEKVQRVEGDANQQKSLDKLVATQRWVAAAILLPIALFVATLIMNVRGGA
jgi:hypothetical protein